MSGARPAPAERLLGLWRRLQPLPAGSWIFSRCLGVMVPYTGSIGAHVRELRPGFARVTMRDRRAVRNHLGSVHAVALVNLGEVASGLALITQLPPGIRSIAVALSIEFLKKARGPLVCESTCIAPPVTASVEHDIVADIRDQAGDTVACIRVRWRLSPPLA
ncbi:MAG: hotdog fold domain-containing protein [Gemmatimonadales bacterium]